MAQSLLTSNGAQSPKPSKYKPIWTDRFFTGLFTNRSPFRSPLSTLYADGYNLGKSDTLIDGVNVELTPRLTLARRPGQLAFSTANTTIANTFYSFHETDGSIMIVEDTATNVNAVTPSAITSIYSKPAAAKQSNFCGLGPNLYWGDGTNCQAYETVDTFQRQMGINSPVLPVGVSSMFGTPGNPLTGTAFQMRGVLVSGLTNYITTTLNVPNYSSLTLEGWCNGDFVGALMSFESSQVGFSSSVMYALYFDSNRQLSLSVLDAAGTSHVIPSGFFIADSQTHHFCVTFSFVPSVTQIIPKGGGGAQNQNPNSTNFTFLSSPTISSGAAPSLATANFYVDGELVSQRNPPIPSLWSGNGYWRLGGASGMSNWNGYISNISVANWVSPGPADHFTIMNLEDASHLIVDTSGYVTRIESSNVKYFWQLQETTGTVAADSIGFNNGTYSSSAGLNHLLPMRYVLYAASTAYVLNQVIVDSNGNLQELTGPGTTGATAPTWATAFQATTADGSAVWTCLGPASFDASSANYKYYYSYVNAQGHYSSLSPASTPIGFANAQVPNIIGNVSTDPQVKSIGIFRTVAGGSTPFLVQTIPHPLVGGGILLWGYLDTATDAELNILLTGPQANSNDPPPYGLNTLAYHMNRLWGAVGNLLYCSGGPDTIVGNGNEAWPPSNSWSYPAPITRVVPSSQGLIVLTVSGVYIHAGGPAIAQFYSQPLFPRVGLANWNALDAKGNEIVMFTSDKQLISVDLSTNTLSDLGYPVLDVLSNFDPTKVYVARHHSGLDNAVYVSNGTTGWLRCVPQQAPDYQITGPVWSPFAGIQF